MVCVKVVCTTLMEMRRGGEEGRDMDHSSSFLASPAASGAGMLPAAVHQSW